MRWKVKEFLNQHRMTPYGLWKTSGLSRNTAYAITGGRMDGVQFDTLARVIHGLEILTNQRVEISDVLEVVRP